VSAVDGAALNLFQNMGTSTKLVDAKGSPDKPVAQEQGITAGRVCTNSALRLAARRLGQLYDEALAPLDLKATQLALIAEIDKLMGADQRGPTLQDLANRLAIQLSALTHALRPLVRDGLVKLHQDAQDRRTKHGVLTPQGRARLSEAMVLWAAANDQVEAVLGPASAANLRALANQVASDAFLTAYKALGPEQARDNRSDHRTE
jgi:DNA-binding MarR family transcriptional regulator